MKNTNHAGQFSPLAEFYVDMMSWPMRAKVEIPSVINVLGNVSGLSVLDFGCGPGYYARKIKSLGAKRVTGYDVADGMLNYAREIELIEQCGIEYISDISESKAQYDIVLSVYVTPYAETVEQLCSMINDMTSLLRPGGRLILLPISPFYTPDETYYLKYGFSLQAQKPHVNGEKIMLSFPKDDTVITVTAWYWSQKTINDVLYQSGLADIRWSFPRKSCPDPFLDDYVDSPHTVIIEGVKK